MRIGAIYIRVSTDDQTEFSPEAQKQKDLAFAKKNGIIVPPEYIIYDDGISGKNVKNRPGFQNLIALAKSEEHPIDVILVWKFSRFARNQEESIVYKNLLKKSNVDVVSVSEPIPEGPIGELVERIFEWMDEYYSINLAEEVLRGMTQRAKTGQYNSAPPLGYKMINREVVVVPEQAETVKKIFEMYVNERMSFFDIAKKLNMLGLKTKRGGKFQNRTVAYILRNQFYNIKNVWNTKDHTTRQAKDKSEWVVTDGNWERIIPEELFEKAQEIDRMTTRKVRKRPTSTYKHWLSGMLVCPTCGGRLVKSYYNQKTGFVNFRCTQYNHAACSNGSTVNASDVTDGILEEFNRILATKEVEFTINASVNSQSEKALLVKELNKMEAKEARIKEAYRDGIDTLDEYKENKKILLKQKQDLINQINNISEDPEVKKEQLLKSIHSALDVISAQNSTDTQKHEALASVVDKIVVDKKKDTMLMYFYIND